MKPAGRIGITEEGGGTVKIDRLMAILLYLMNHETVSASLLAERFEVTRRTIQRDMETLGQAGVPVVSALGAGGGYGVMDGFRLLKPVTRAEDYRNIVTALRGLSTAYDSREVEETLHKALLRLPQREQRVFVDFSAAGESPAVRRYLRMMERAAAGETLLRLDYTGADGEASQRTVEPLALSLRWYAWYLFAWCREKRDYRLFKLQRVTACKEVPGGFSKKHGDIETLMEQSASRDGREQYRVRLRCAASVRGAALEYLGGAVVKELPGGDCELLLPERPFERMWFSLLMGFGGGIEVLEPDTLRRMLREKAREMTALY